MTLSQHSKDMLKKISGETFKDQSWRWVKKLMMHFSNPNKTGRSWEKFDTSFSQEKSQIASVAQWLGVALKWVKMFSGAKRRFEPTSSWFLLHKHVLNLLSTVVYYRQRLEQIVTGALIRYFFAFLRSFAHCARVHPKYLMNAHMKEIQKCRESISDFI